MSRVPLFTISLQSLTTLDQFPFVQSGAWAVQENKLLLIGGRLQGFHGLAQNEPGFSESLANRTIWVIHLDNFSFQGLFLDPTNPKWQPLCSSNMQFEQDGDTLYVAGGFGAKLPTDKQSNHTFNTLFVLSVSKMITLVEKQGDPAEAILATYSSPLFQVTGGELFKLGDIFFLIFGQDFGEEYVMGETGVYTCQARAFKLEGNTVTSIRNCTNENFHRRDLNAVPIMQRKGVFFAGLGGVFKKNGDGYSQPVYFDPSVPDCSVTLDSLRQLTNQYNCARISLYDSASDTHFTVLLGGIGQNQYHSQTGQWENGDDGAKLPFVKSITQMIYSDGQMNQFVQLPPDQPEMPAFLGANAIFIPYPGLLYSRGVIDYSKLSNGATTIGLMYGGILSLRPTSSEIYPTTVNKTIYKVILNK